MAENRSEKTYARAHLFWNEFTETGCIGAYLAYRAMAAYAKKGRANRG